jgi:hypothetical protein
MGSRVHTTIRYDGAALADHEIDVQQLAPALLALAEIVQIANRRFNGDAAAMRVLVKTDPEQHCFQIDLHLVQSFFDQARTLLGKEDVKTAKEIAEFVGLIGGAGVFGLLAWLFGRKPESESKIEVQTSDGGTTLITRGDGNQINVTNHVYQLAADPAVQAQAKAVLKPLERRGYETLDFVADGVPSFHIEKEEARAVIAAPTEPLTENESFFSSIQAQVEITTAQYKGNAQWGLWWTGRTRFMKIEDEEWLQSFQAGHESNAGPGAWLDVTLEITQPRDRDLPASYVVRKVNGVIPPEEPGELFPD